MTVYIADHGVYRGEDRKEAMSTSALAPGGVVGVAVKSRDADHTRRLLLGAARQRFAQDGYSSTTVRDIATDAGVNVALINRYFVSKEGLFEACLTSAAEDLGDGAGESTTLEQVVQSMVRQVADAPNSDQPLQLLLLLRSSGDERADAIRRATLESFARRIAAAVRPDGIGAGAGAGAGDDDLVLRAQLVIAAAMGIVLLRKSTGLEPLASAGPDDLATPVGDLLTALLAGR
jgi:AcrR family transcriptional regulator